MEHLRNLRAKARLLNRNDTLFIEVPPEFNLTTFQNRITASLRGLMIAEKYKMRYRTSQDKDRNGVVIRRVS